MSKSWQGGNDGPALLVRHVPELPQVVGLDGAVAVIGGAAAYRLLRYGGLADYHREHRGVDPILDRAIESLKVASAHWRATRCGTDAANAGGWRPSSPDGLSTAEAGRLLGITARGVRWAISTGRLRGQLVGHRYVLDPEEVEIFRAQRAA